MDEYRAWLAQAESDLKAARRVLDPREESSYCQSITKSQQTVEKSVKGLVAALKHHGIANVVVGRGHDVEPYMSVLVRQYMPKKRQLLQSLIRRGFDQATRGGVRALDRLVPRWPQPGGLHSRNTEYPYQIEAGNHWHAPSETPCFSLDEVIRFSRLADRVARHTADLVSFMDRGGR